MAATVCGWLVLGGGGAEPLLLKNADDVLLLSALAGPDAEPAGWAEEAPCD